MLLTLRSEHSPTKPWKQFEYFCVKIGLYSRAQTSESILDTFSNQTKETIRIFSYENKILFLSLDQENNPDIFVWK
jgi:hypothetical protein